MTGLRFTGDLPLWIGLSLAVIVAILAWRYYRREVRDLPPRLRWILPVLRSTAFFIGIMILTGPVLNHRQIIGELGRLRIYVDGSSSMAMTDRHMATARKLLIAEQLGWLPDGTLDMRLNEVADQLESARLEFVDAMNLDSETRDVSPGDAAPQPNGPAAVVDPEQLQQAVARFVDGLKAIESDSSGLRSTSLRGLVDSKQNGSQGDPAASGSEAVDEVAVILDRQLIQPLIDQKMPEPPIEKLPVGILEVVDRCGRIEAALREEFEEVVDALAGSDDQAVTAALLQFDETPRWQRVEAELMDEDHGLLGKLKNQHELGVFILSAEDVLPVGTEDASLVGLPDIAGLADSTNLYSGISASSAAAGRSEDSTPVDKDSTNRSAVVLLTDGQHNTGPSPLQLARVLGGQGIPLYCVSLGASRPAPDLAVVDLEHPDLVFQKDLVRGVLSVRDRFSAGTPFVAQVQYRDEVLWRKQLVTENSGDRRIEFEFSVDELVDRLSDQLDARTVRNTVTLELEATLSNLPEEVELGNNQKTMRLAAITQKYRVLILDGRSRWETRYLRNVFERDEQWHVSTVIAGPGTDHASLPRGEQADHFPSDRSELLDHDLVILGEINPDLFQAHELEWLREFVELKGGGLILIDGNRGYLPRYEDTVLGPLVPVEWTPDEITELPESMVLTDAGTEVRALQLATDEQENPDFWGQLPPPRNCSNVSELPGCEVLVEAKLPDRNTALIVTRLYGAGRVVFFASDETWRWRYKVSDKWHQRFWNQMANFVMPRPFAVSGEYLSIDTGSVSYDAGDEVDVRIQLAGLDGRPAEEVSVDALVWKDGRIQSTISLAEDEELPGTYRGTSVALPEGDYEVSIRAAGYSDAALQVRSRFTVLPPDSAESVQTEANESLLKQMASVSRGRYLREEELAGLTDLLSPLSDGRVVETETRLWQSYWCFALFLALVTLEWILRKRAGLL